MRSFIVFVMSLLIVNSIYADDYSVAKLRLKVNSHIENNDYFVCLPDAGCFSLAAAAGGKVFLIDPQKIDGVLTADTSKARIYAQKTPTSCLVTVNQNQTLTISGTLTHSGASLTNLKCKVT